MSNEITFDEIKFGDRIKAREALSSLSIPTERDLLPGPQDCVPARGLTPLCRSL